MDKPQTHKKASVKAVSGFNINPEEAHAYHITGAFCGRCGLKGYDKCPACRKWEQDRIAALEAIPGGKEIEQPD